MDRIIFLGDIFGKPGRRFLKAKLPEIIEEYKPDLVIANGENASGGLGLEAKAYLEIIKSGVQIITTGNHIWQKKDLLKFLEDYSDTLIRPANYPEGTPGYGSCIFQLPSGKKIGIFNLLGRVFIPDLVDCPFRKADSILSEKIFSKVDYSILDFHAEATSEKISMGFHLDGRVGAVLGTHTHVQTADERILPKGTAFITDVGMCGPHNSVIGVSPDTIIQRFMTARQTKFEVAGGISQINGVCLDFDPTTNKVSSIKRIRLIESKDSISQ